MKKYVFIFLSFITQLSSTFAATRETTSNAIKDNIIPGENHIISDANNGGEFNPLDSLLTFVKDSIFGLMMLIGIGVFLFIGIKLLIARGNPEEFKKAMMHFIYAVIGIAVVSLAWAAVKLVGGITF